MPAEKDFDVTRPARRPLVGHASAHAPASTAGSSSCSTRRPGLRIEPPAAAATVGLAFGLKAENADGTPMILIGQAGGSRLELRALRRAACRCSSARRPGAPSPAVQLGAVLELKQGKLVIDASQADGFIGTLLGGVKVESAFDLGALYDTDEGLRFTGSATIEIAIPDPPRRSARSRFPTST